MDNSTAATALQTFLAQAGAQFQGMVQELGQWVSTGPRTLAAIAHQTLAAVKGLGQQVLAGVGQVAAGRTTPPTTPCACGQQAAYQRQRLAQVRTVLGPMTIRRA